MHLSQPIAGELNVHPAPKFLETIALCNRFIFVLRRTSPRFARAGSVS
jgi:hypothetical protein